MSRIYEAMRKASELEQAEATTEETAATTADAESLSRETFPIELGERRRARAAAPIAASFTPPHAAAAAPDDSVQYAAGGGRFERIDARYAGKIVVDQEIAAASLEQYRRLAASLHHAQQTHGIKVVMVTSALMSEGKTLTASNLALTLSESYQRQVLIVDADLRRPSLHTLFKMRPSAGLTEALVDGSDRKVPLHQLTTHLGVLAAGRPTTDPMARLTSGRMQQLLDEARESFDWIIVDTPPVAMLPDANLLGSMVDGALVVVRAGHTPYDLVERAVAAVGRERVLGVVLNSVTQHQHAGYYHYYYGQAEAPTQPA